MNNPPFARLPLVVDSLSSNTGNNMYIVKKGKILDQVNIGDLNIGYPDYLCYTSEFGVIDVLLRGTGRGTNIIPKNPGFSCGPMPVEPDFREQETISNDVVTSAQGNNPIINDIIYTNPSAPSTSTLRDGFTSNTQPEIQRVIESRAERTRRVTDISRTIDCDGDRATVEIRIKPQYQMTGFRYIESIPKACLPSLSSFDIDTDTLRIDGQLEVAIVEDPLIMWRFNSITREQRIEYELDTCLRECEELIQGMAFAERIETTPAGEPAQADDFTTDEILYEGEPERYVPRDVVNLNTAIAGTSTTVTDSYLDLAQAVEAYEGDVRIEIRNTVEPLDEIDEIRIDFGGNKRARYRSATDIGNFLVDASHNFASGGREPLNAETPILTALQDFLREVVINRGGADDGKIDGQARFDIKLEKEPNEQG